MSTPVQLQVLLPDIDTLAQTLGSAALGELERHLSRGDPGEGGGALLSDLQNPGSTSFGAISRELACQDAANRWWARIEPATLQAGLSGVGLVGLPALEPDEQVEVGEILNDAFRARDWQCLADPNGGFWLAADQPLSISGTDPLAALGRDIHQPLSGGGDASVWRMVSGEVEINLHHAPLNQRRTESGLPMINGVWLWGGGTAPARPSSPSQVATDDSAQQIVARWHGAEVILNPEDAQHADWRCLNRLMDPASLEPALNQILQRSMPCQIHLQGAKSYRIAPRNRWRFWRKSRSLSEL